MGESSGIERLLLDAVNCRVGGASYYHTLMQVI